MAEVNSLLEDWKKKRHPQADRTGFLHDYAALGGREKLLDVKKTWR
jgi:hypothetical protein